MTQNETQKHYPTPKPTRPSYNDLKEAQINVWVNPQNGYWETDFPAPANVQVFTATLKEIRANNQNVMSALLLDQGENL